MPYYSDIAAIEAIECADLARRPRLYTMPGALVTVICKRLSTVS
jgi:hypothetical protein